MSRRNDINFLLDRYLKIAARSSPGKPRTEDAADLALADLLIALARSRAEYQELRRDANSAKK
jgi:hypothetical protein